MGWRGTIRSLSAAANAIDRDNRRRHKQALREQIAADAADAVTDWEQHIEELISIHTNLADPIDWHTISNQLKPQEPVLQRTHQESASEALKKFKPSFVHIFQGGSNRKREKLENALAHAPEDDAAVYEKDKARYAKALTEWEAETGLACRLVKGESAALKEVIQELQSLSQEGLIGSSVAFSISDRFVHAQPEVHSEEIVPNFRRKQLATGKLSETKMPVGQFNELYQDYVASVALKVAGDLFRILPLDEIYVTCMARMLNTQTGHQELTPILSVQFVRESMVRIDLARVDPSDSLSNFNYAMDFKKTKGFAPITPLESIE
jgi:hypothetical protein